MLFGCINAPSAPATSLVPDYLNLTVDGVTYAFTPAFYAFYGLTIEESGKRSFSLTAESGAATRSPSKPVWFAISFDSSNLVLSTGVVSTASGNPKSLHATVEYPSAVLGDADIQFTAPNLYANETGNFELIMSQAGSVGEKVAGRFSGKLVDFRTNRSIYVGGSFSVARATDSLSRNIVTAER